MRLTFPTKLLKLLLSLNISNLLLALSSSKQSMIIPLLSSSIEAIVFFIVFSDRTLHRVHHHSLEHGPVCLGPGFLCIICIISVRMFWLLVGARPTQPAWYAAG